MFRSSGLSLDYFYCHFNFRLPFRNRGPAMNDLQERLPRLPEFPVILSGSYTSPVAGAFQTLVEVDMKAATALWDQEMAVMRLVKEMAIASDRLLQKSPHADSMSQVIDRRVMMVCRKITQHPNKAWKVAELARFAGVTTGLCRPFSSSTWVSP